MERKLIEYPGNLMMNAYYQVLKEDDYLDIRYVVRPHEGEIHMWIGSDKPTYRGFRNPEEFKDFVKELNKAVEELDAMKKEGLI